MKPSKILLYTLIVALIVIALMMFTGCTNDEVHSTIAVGWNYRLKMIDHYTNGMHYKIYFCSDSGGLGIINVTLDSLKVEQLKLAK